MHLQFITLSPSIDTPKHIALNVPIKVWMSLTTVNTHDGQLFDVPSIIPCIIIFESHFIDRYNTFCHLNTVF